MSLWPVSYTHLDVYKRQQESSVTQHQVLILHTAIMRDSGTISAAPTMQRFQVLHHAEPVSYTHLDVYKRQEETKRPYKGRAFRAVL